MNQTQYRRYFLGNALLLFDVKSIILLEVKLVSKTSSILLLSKFERSVGMITTTKKTGRPRVRPPESELAALYAKHTTTEIAARYHVSYWTVNNWVQYYRRNPESHEMSKHIKVGGRRQVRPSEAELAALYAKHTTAEIAAMYDVSYWTVNNWVQFYRQKPVSHEMKKYVKGGGRPNKRPAESELAALYAEHTAAEIAAMYGVSLWTVRKWIQYYRDNPENREGIVQMPEKAMPTKPIKKVKLCG